VESLSPICEGANGVAFQVIVTHKTDGTPLSGATPGAEVFATMPGAWDAAGFCDTMSTQVTSSRGAGFWPLTEGPAGTYTGVIGFDQPGQWTVRFHLFHDCFDTLADSPHSHPPTMSPCRDDSAHVLPAMFRLDVPALDEAHRMACVATVGVGAKPDSEHVQVSAQTSAKNLSELPHSPKQVCAVRPLV
jgi:hypothetical protein